MADIQYGTDNAGFAAAEAARKPSMVNWLGAAVSLSLVIGLGVWGYKLAVRDVSGIPVVRALEGPGRVQPEDPGGSQARHQGLSVNNVLAEGQAAPAADRLILAPEPIELIAADTPVSTAVEQALAQANADVTPADGSATTEITEITEVAAVSTEAVEAVEIAEAIESQVAAEATPAAPRRDIIAASVPGPARSPRPTHRPEGDLVARAIAAAFTVSQTAGVHEVDAATIAPGTRLVQLGAYDSHELANAAWEQISARFSDYFLDKDRVVQQAERGGRTFWRLRAMGFSDISDARRFCSVLLAGDAACIPVVIR